MTSFRYQTLNSAKNEVRLLASLNKEIETSKASSRTLSISHTSLDDYPDYVALSYVWGSRSPQEALSLYDGVSTVSKTLGINTNLASSLPELIAFANGRAIWIDALCINQEDDQEKSWQVALMQRIYQQAKSVFIWLGPDADGGSSVLSQLDVVGARVQSEPVLWKWEYLYWYNIFHQTPPSPAEMVHLTRPSTFQTIEPLLKEYKVNDSSSASISHTNTQKLLQRPWWQRVWVFQEIVLPGIDCGFDERRSRNEQIIFACGTSRSNLNHVAAALTVFRLYLSASAGGLYGSGARMVVPELDARSFLMLSARMWTERVSLLTLLRATSAHTGVENRLAATDPRDRVYALLSISDDKDPLKIFPDYTQSCQQVYTNVAATLIRQNGPDVMLYGYFPKKLEDLPSWVPDWSAESNGYTICLPQGTTEHRFDKFMAAVDPPFQPYHFASESVSDPTFLKDNQILCVMGVQLATISEIINSTAWQQFRTTAASLLEARQFIGRPHSMFSPNYNPPTTPEEAQQMLAANNRRQLKPTIMTNLQQSLDLSETRTSHSEPFVNVQVNDDDPLWETLEHNPAIEFEWVDTKNYQAYLQCINDLQTELRRLSQAQSTTYYSDTRALENAIWRTPVADQGMGKDIREWIRPSKQACGAILFSTIMFNAAFNLNISSWPEWVKDTWLDWVHEKLKLLGIFAEDVKRETIRFMFVNPENEPRINIIGYGAGRFGLGIKRHPGDGKNESDLCSIMYKPMDELAVMCCSMGSLKGEQYASKENVNQGLSDGTIKLEDIIYAIRLETSRAIQFDEPQLVGLMINTVQYLREAVLQAVGRTIFATSQGLLGLGPQHIEVNDVVVALAGSAGLMVLHPIGNGQFRFVGEAYLHGAMDGELAVEGGASVTEFHIV